MKTDVYFLSYCAQLVLECGVFHKKVVQKIKARISCLITFPPPENRAVHELMCTNTVQPDRPQPNNKTRHMRIAYWIPKATNTLLEYVIRIAFPPQQCLHERASILLCTYTVCLV